MFSYGESPLEVLSLFGITSTHLLYTKTTLSQQNNPTRKDNNDFDIKSLHYTSNFMDGRDYVRVKFYLDCLFVPCHDIK